MTTKAQIGQAVQVDLAGLKAPGITLGEGVLGLGEIVQLDPGRRKVTVKLKDLTFGGDEVSYIEAPAGQVTVLGEQTEAAQSSLAQVSHAT